MDTYTKAGLDETNSGFIKSCIEANIFDNKLLDSGLYFVLYIVIPIAMAVISLTYSKGKQLERIYTYIGILINALGCGYDLINRRSDNRVRNSKILLMGISLVFVVLVCVIGIALISVEMSTTITDIFLCAYFVLSSIAIIDILHALFKNLDFRPPIPKDVL